MVLDIKRDRGLGEALRALMSMPEAWLYILDETLRAKLKAYAPGLSAGLGHGEGKVRYLIGPQLNGGAR